MQYYTEPHVNVQVVSLTWYMSCVWCIHTCIIQLGRSLNSCVYIYVQLRVVHTLCVTTKKWQLISVSCCF